MILWFWCVSPRWRPSNAGYEIPDVFHSVTRMDLQFANCKKNMIICNVKQNRQKSPRLLMMRLKILTDIGLLVNSEHSYFPSGTLCQVSTKTSNMFDTSFILSCGSSKAINHRYFNSDTFVHPESGPCIYLLIIISVPIHITMVQTACKVSYTAFLSNIFGLRCKYFSVNIAL